MAVRRRCRQTIAGSRTPIGTSRSVSGAIRNTEVYLRSMDESGVRKVVSAGGGINPRWRADGRELFYESGQTLMSVAVTPGPS